MMIVDPVERFHMQRDPSIHGEGLKKLTHKLGVEFADLPAFEIRLEHEEGTAGNIDSDPGEGFVHGQKGIGIAHDAFHIAQRLAKGLPQGDAYVFHCMVEIDVQIAFRLDIKVNEPMAAKLVEHMVEKADPGRDSGLAGTIQGHADLDFRFLGSALDAGFAHNGGVPVDVRGF